MGYFSFVIPANAGISSTYFNHIYYQERYTLIIHYLLRNPIVLVNVDSVFAGTATIPSSKNPVPSF
jgi:hypothetical protein